MFKLMTYKQTAWDYFDITLSKKYPYVFYVFHNSDTKIYTIKCLWTNEHQHTGLIYIMDNRDLPHQGKCLNVWEIKNHILSKGLFNKPT